MDRCIILFFCLLVFPCHAQTTGDEVVGGRCEGCEAIHDYKLENIDLTHFTTIFGHNKAEEPVIVQGTVYKSDELTPAPNVIIYAYQTNTDGVYQATKNASGWAARHGQHRGWIKTDEKGRYIFNTFKPASYPNSRIPAHIHMTVLEPDKNEYYIDDIMFDDDPFLTNEMRENPIKRAGNGVVKIKYEGGIGKVRRDIILGKDIENYPK